VSLIGADAGPGEDTDADADGDAGADAVRVELEVVVELVVEDDDEAPGSEGRAAPFPLASAGLDELSGGDVGAGSGGGLCAQAASGRSRPANSTTARRRKEARVRFILVRYSRRASGVAGRFRVPTRVPACSLTF
jgi:hypothetical protein